MKAKIHDNDAVAPDSQITGNAASALLSVLHVVC